jgi:hypothetical protein
MTPQKLSLYRPNMAVAGSKPKRGSCMQHEPFRSKEAKHIWYWRLALFFVEKLKMKSGFSARRAKLGHTKTDWGCYVCETCAHECWAEVDVHHLSISPVFSPLFLAYYYIPFIRCLHNMIYDSLIYDILRQQDFVLILIRRILILIAVFISYFILKIWMNICLVLIYKI